MKSIKIMGILNVTPDSFYDGGSFQDTDRAVRHAIEMAAQGAHIIDIGGESSRPGAEPVSLQEEIDRVCPVIEILKREIDIPLSIDTCKSPVAHEALLLGAEIVNDISGLSSDEEMVKVAASHDAAVIIMHMQGSPETMQNDPHYNDIIGEIKTFLHDAAEKALRYGIKKDKIILDPGIGFGKSLEDNYKIIHSVNNFRDLGYPILMGLSRKSLIGQLIGNDENRLPGTIALNALCVAAGAEIIRVHDVKEHVLACQCLEYYIKVNS